MSARLREALSAAASRTEPGSPVVLAGWGTPEECEATRALPIDPLGAEGAGRASDGRQRGGRAALEELAAEAGLVPVDAGRVECPFGYADLDSAVRGLLSTGFCRSVVEPADERRVVRELSEVLRGRCQPDGTVWLPSLFHYVVARS